MNAIKSNFMKGILVLGLCIVAVVCSKSSNMWNRSVANKATIDSIIDKSLEGDSLNLAEKILPTVPKNIKPVMGYRFVIRGDFDGDGRQDTLTEHFTSLLNGKETNKYYDSLDSYEQLVALTVQKDPASFVSSNTKSIDTLFISAGGQLLGLAYLKNEGDLDGDGGDEVSYVVDAADWSSINTCYIMSFKHHKWKELYNFGIWDWQIPPLPQFTAQYGPFGVAGMMSTVGNDTINAQLQKQLDAWPGFVKKICNNKIRVTFRNENADMDTMVVDLRHLKKKPRSF